MTVDYANLKEFKKVLELTPTPWADDYRKKRKNISPEDCAFGSLSM